MPNDKRPRISREQWMSTVQYLCEFKGLTGRHGKFEIVVRDGQFRNGVVIAAVEPGTKVCFISNTSGFTFEGSSNGTTKVRIADGRLMAMTEATAGQAVDEVQRFFNYASEYASRVGA